MTINHHVYDVRLFRHYYDITIIYMNDKSLSIGWIEKLLIGEMLQRKSYLILVQMILIKLLLLLVVII